MEGSSMTDNKLYDLSAEVQEWLNLAPELVSQFHEVVPVDHTPPETFEGFTWFVVVCNPKCERRAQLGLRRAGYQTYLPMTKKWKIVSRQKQEAENPLFPRYLFIGLRNYGRPVEEGGQDLYKLRGVDGVEKVVRFEGAPVEVPVVPLTRLLARETAREFDFTRLPEVGPQYRPGEIVRLSAGAFTDLTAHVVSMLSKGRVEVLLDFMGRGTKVRVKATELERLEAAE
jgi:transcriptional antiterminator RfaH